MRPIGAKSRGVVVLAMGFHLLISFMYLTGTGSIYMNSEPIDLFFMFG